MNINTHEFDAYCNRYLNQWEARATIKSTPRTRLDAKSAQSELYPPELIRILSHPTVAYSHPDVRHRIMAREMATFLMNIVIVESELITKLCIDLSLHGAGKKLPETAKRVALTVAIDESYHAYVAREYLEDLKLFTGITPWTDATSSLIVALDEIRIAAPKAIIQVAETMVLCFAENYITEELFELSKDSTPKTPFHTMLREHMMDEGRHQLFFQKLFKYIWSNLDDFEKSQLGELIAIFLDKLIDSSDFVKSQISLLEFAGYDKTTSEMIVYEMITKGIDIKKYQKFNIPFLRNICNLIHASSILEHPPTLNIMIEKGWADIRSTSAFMK